MRQHSSRPLGRFLRLAAIAMATLVVVLAALGAVDGALYRQTGPSAATSVRRSSTVPVPGSWLFLAESTATVLTLLAGGLALIGWGFNRTRPARGADARVQQLEVEARTDNLTRLGNHRAFHHDLNQLIALRAATGTVFTLMAIDLNGLKQINDTRGHPAGDAFIRAVTECLTRAIGSSGTVYRTGGDEFMALLPGKRNWHGLTLAHRIEHSTRVATGGRAVSIGLTESLASEGRHLLIHQADLALYEAKRTKLAAVAFHPGLTSTDGGEEENDGPSHDQRALAAALARAVDAKDSETRSHSETVAQLCVAIGQRLDVESTNLERLRLAGLLHDVGKIGVADAILLKPEKLVPAERQAMDEHVEIGHAILIAAELPTEAHWVLHHHERYDGSGHPQRLHGTSIPLEARIIAVADAFEAMTGVRPYRDSVTGEEALEELEAHAGTQFDPRCVKALVDVIRDTAEEATLRLVPAPPERRADPRTPALRAAEAS